MHISYFNPIFFSKKTLKNNSNNFLFKHKLTEVENRYKDIAGFDLIIKVFKGLCRQAWKDEYDSGFCIGSSKKVEKKHCICNEIRPIMFIEWIPEAIFF